MSLKMKYEEKLLVSLEIQGLNTRLTVWALLGSPPGQEANDRTEQGSAAEQAKPASYPNPLQAARVLLPGVFSHKKKS